MEILRVVDYNRSYVRQPKADLVWFNRTTRAMNISAYLLKDVNKGYRVIIKNIVCLNIKTTFRNLLVFFSGLQVLQ